MPVPAWSRGDKDLPVVEVDVTWVRFSTMNHRTRAEQRREIHLADRPDLFTANPLGEDAQKAQYKILCHQEGFTELKADLKDRGQQEPAIITADGVLINGNRRSAALRSLYLDDDHLNARNVRCLILPQDATADELVDLEAELQVARDFKQDYSWINEALLIEELYDREHKDFTRVAKRMHRDVGDVRALHERLQQAHQLVALSQGARMLIDFEDNESAFTELAKHIKNKSPVEAESVKHTYFLGTLANVQYRKLRNLRRSDAAQLVRRELEGDPTLSPLLKAAESVKDEELDELLGPSDSSPSLGDVLSFLATKKPEETVTLGGEHVAVQSVLDSLNGAITAVADEAGEEQRDQVAVKAPLVRVDKAIDELRRAFDALPKARAFSDWDESDMAERMDKLDATVKRLKESR
jgi:hypothetical protein